MKHAPKPINPVRPTEVVDTVRSSPTGLPYRVTLWVLKDAFCDIRKQPTAPSSSSMQTTLLTWILYTLPFRFGLYPFGIFLGFADLGFGILPSDPCPSVKSVVETFSIPHSELRTPH